MPSVLITGSNSGLGLEFVRQYAVEGWHVVATCRSPDKATDLKAVDGDIEVRALDVADFDAVDRLATDLTGTPLDVLILNAGKTKRPQGIGTMDYEAWAEIFRVNTMAPLKMAEALVENVATSDQKKIIGISSRLASIEFATAEDRTFKLRGAYYPYRTTKAALNMVMRTMAAELAPRGILTASLCPGWVRTKMGGDNATFSTAESVGWMRAIAARLTAAESGTFFSHEGEVYPF
jgi:NAD(P)-dependent dehydrogenase (short-subunit alcohol dehydrogenase family)